MKWFAVCVLVIISSGLGSSATLGADKDVQKCNGETCTDDNSKLFDHLLGTTQAKDKGYQCVTLEGDIKIAQEIYDTTPKLSKVDESLTGTQHLKIDDQCAFQYKDKDICDFIKEKISDKNLIDSCETAVADGAYQFSASFSISAILFLCVYLFQ